MHEDDLFDIRCAYLTLNVDEKAADHVIKSAYLNAMKTWHPDKWMHDEEGHAKALRKSKEITEAYQKIKHAPLRYHISTHPKVQEKWKKRQPRREWKNYPKRNVDERPPPRPYYATYRNKTEKFIRFVSGFLFGLFVTAQLSDLPLFISEEHQGLINIGLYFAFPSMLGWINMRARDDVWFNFLDSRFFWDWYE